MSRRPILVEVGDRDAFAESRIDHLHPEGDVGGAASNLRSWGWRLQPDSGERGDEEVEHDISKTVGRCDAHCTMGAADNTCG